MSSGSPKLGIALPQAHRFLSRLMASGGFVVHFAHHLRAFVPGNPNVAFDFPHSHIFAITLTASVGLQCLHQRGTLMGFIYPNVGRTLPH
jgi:hypothetical protein